MAKKDPLDRLVEDLIAYLKSLPEPTENDNSYYYRLKARLGYREDIKKIMQKWVNSASSRFGREKRREKACRIMNCGPTPWSFLKDWPEIEWSYFEEGVEKARKVTDKEIKEKIAHNGKAEAQKRNQKSRPKKKTKDGMLYFGVCTDRVFNMLVKNESSKIEVAGDFSYRVKWIHDVFSEKLWQYILERNLLELKKEERQLLATEDFTAMTEELFSSFKEYLPVIRFTDKEFKEITGLKHLRNHQIAELVEKYICLRVKGESKALLDPDTGKYKRIKVIGSFADVFIEETGNYSQRFQQPEHVYIFSLNFWGLVLFQNFLNKSYAKFPKEYYKLSAEGQELYRNIAQHGQSKFSPERIRKIMGYAESTRTVQIIERASKHLNKMKAAGLINWKRIDNKEGKMGFCIWRTGPHQLATESRTGMTDITADSLI